MVPSTDEMWRRWMMEAEYRRRIEKVRQAREALARRPRRPPGRIRCIGRRPKVRP